MVLFQESAESFLRDTIPGAKDVTFTSWSPEFGKEVVRMAICPNCPAITAERIRTSIKSLKSMISDLSYDMVDGGAKVAENDQTQDRPALPVTKNQKMQCINLLIYCMHHDGKRFHEGKIVSKDPRSTASFTMVTPLRSYLNKLCESPTYNEVITPQLDHVVSFLERNPDYGGIQRIKYDMNLIEVRNFLLYLFP